MGIATLLSLDAKLGSSCWARDVTASTPERFLGGYHFRGIILIAQASRRLTGCLTFFDTHLDEVELAETGFVEDHCT